MDKLESKLDELYSMIKGMKRSFDHLVESKSLERTKGKTHKTTFSDLISTPIAEIYGKSGNPLALKSAQKLVGYQIGRQMIEDAYNTFEPTITALKSSEEGLTAQEIGEITGRARNTESGYLKRLERAGFARKKLKNGKAIYSLIDEESLPEVFG